MRAAFAVIVTVCSATIALADDFKTINGKEYKNATVKRVESDGVVVKSSGGIVKIPFAELPPEIQQKYGHNAEQAAPTLADFKTIDGTEYKNVKVSHVEPDGIVVTFSGGIAKLYFAELPPEVQQRFNYDPEKAAAYSAEQAAASAQARESQGKLRRKYEAQFNRGWQEEQWQRGVKDLQGRYQILQQQENSLVRQIAELKALPETIRQQLGYHHWNTYPNPARKNLPVLENSLKNVRQDKEQVRQQLADAGQ
jgi:hypothetical protein